MIKPAPASARALLEGTALLGALDAAAIDELTREMDWIGLLGGEVLFRQGDAADALYIVVSGRLRVMVESGGQKRVIREVGRNETVGELGLLTGEPRSATVVATRDAELGRISRETFDRLLEHHPRAIHGLTRVLAAWLLESNRGPAPDASPTLLAVVPFAAHGDCSATARRLVAALEPFGRTLHVTSELVEHRVGAGAAHSQNTAVAARVTAWLAEREAEHRFVVCEADGNATPWTRRCVRQADRVLVVADDADGPRVGPIADVLAAEEADGFGPTADLVLVHRGDSPVPGRTRRFLSACRFSHHHHIRRSSDDIHRLARKLTGNAVGLVLSGGGARAFAQLGVIRVLAEHGIVVDRVGGSSMGAVIAAQLACGLSVDEMIEMNRTGWNDFAPHKAYTLPVISMLSSTKAERMLESMFGERQYEDLWLDCYAMSTNLTRSRPVMHTHGPLTKWLRASISIPGTAPPVMTDDGDLLVDGGVLSNLPVAAMLSMGEGPVIAVDVLPGVDLTVDGRYSSTPGPARALLDRFASFGERRPFPTIFSILYRTALISNLRSLEETRSSIDLYLDPPVETFDIFEMQAIDRIVDVGYRFAKTRVPASSAALRRERRATPSVPRSVPAATNGASECSQVER